MKYITLLILSSLLLACSPNPQKEIMPIVASIYHIDCNCYEDTLLDKKSPDTIRKLFFWISLKNPNDIDLYIPFRSVFDTMYCSEIGVFMDTIRIHRYMVTKDMNFKILKAHNRSSMRIRLFEDLDKNSLGVTHDVKELLKRLKFKYMKCEADTLYCRNKMADMNFVIYDSLKIEYRKIECKSEE